MDQGWIIVVFAHVDQDGKAQPVVPQGFQQRHGIVVGEVSLAATNALLQEGGVGSPAEHVGTVVGFNNDGMGTGQAGDGELAGVAEVGGEAEFRAGDRCIGVVDGIDGVMGDGITLDADISEGQGIPRAEGNNAVVVLERQFAGGGAGGVHGDVVRAGKQGQSPDMVTVFMGNEDGREVFRRDPQQAQPFFQALAGYPGVLKDMGFAVGNQGSVSLASAGEQSEAQHVARFLWFAFARVKDGGILPETRGDEARGRSRVLVQCRPDSRGKGWIMELTNRREDVVYLIANTHWDREWLFDYQRTRLMLVELLDRLLEILETRPDYRSFVLDGQVAPLEDYLEIRPEKREAVERAVREQRLLIGPWYTCPEGFEVNGESLVRNLLMGHRVGRRFGGVMKIGHTPFSYGQNSQMAQLYAGFGIGTILFYHGVNDDEAAIEFVLEGADGTRLLASRMSTGARYNFYHQVYRPARYGKGPEDREYHWREGGLPFRRSTPDRASGHMWLLRPRVELDPEVLRDRAKALYAREKNAAATRHLAFMMGHDSSLPDEREPDMVRQIAEALPGVIVRHGHYPDLIAGVLAEADRDRLPVLRGERRTPKPMPLIIHLYSDVLSSRARMKWTCSRAEWTLQRLAEPALAAASLVTGMAYPHGVMELAWKELLRCHAHDSISGSGVDAIEEDVLSRARQTEHIAEAVTDDALAALHRRIRVPGDDEDVVLSVFNPLPRARSEVVECVVDLPWTGGHEEFTLEDPESGARIPVQCNGRLSKHVIVNHPDDAPMMMKAERFHACFPAESVPGLGWKTFRVRRGPAFASGAPIAVNRELDNGLIRARINDNGTVCLTHLETGQVYGELNYYVDDGEAGHAWMHHAPAHEAAIDSRGFPATIATLENGPLLGRISVSQTLMVPECLVENGGDPWRRLDGVGNNASRSGHLLPMPLVTTYTLRRGAPYLEVTCRFSNPARDHRLRVMFPTELNTRTCHAETAFDIVEREVLFGEGSPWMGRQGVTFPMQRFVDVNDGRVGLAFLSPGLREYEVTQGRDRSLAVTLLRAYEVNLTTVSKRWDPHPEMGLSQCPGQHEYRWLLYPHGGDTFTGEVLNVAEAMVTPLQPCQAGANPEGDLPGCHGIMEMDGGQVALSAMKPAEDGQGWIVRLYNPGTRPERVVLRFGFAVTSLSRCTMEETEPENDPAIPVQKGRAELEIGPKKIVTLRVRSG